MYSARPLLSVRCVPRLPECAVSRAAALAAVAPIAAGDIIESEGEPMESDGDIIESEGEPMESDGDITASDGDIEPVADAEAAGAAVVVEPLEPQPATRSPVAAAAIHSARSMYSLGWTFVRPRRT